MEPFQGEPQLLDAKLKYILPPLIDAYLEYLLRPHDHPPKQNLDLETAICIIIYTLCKIRGQKVIVGFLSNEPRHFEAVLQALENTIFSGDDHSPQPAWQVPYVLLLWVSHLLFTPFDLASISDKSPSADEIDRIQIPDKTPPLAARVVIVGLKYLYTSTKAQDAASAMLVRLVIRPDMQKLSVADSIVAKALDQIQGTAADAPVTIYERLGPLRLLSGVATSADLAHLIPNIYRTCEKLANDEDSSAVTTNAVAKKLTVKIFRNIAILCLRTSTAQGPLLSFLESTGVLEDVIDYLLRSLADRDTPVRYAAAKAISMIVIELEPEMGHEVIQAVLDSFWEDVPRTGSKLDFRTANALKWHGLTLALAHSLFKRTASPEQLPDIINALVSALQFEQRTATGSSIGTNVRDAANFGIWSMSRRYTTTELLDVSTATLRFVDEESVKQTSVIPVLAIQLILSACLDPAGNIRRGSSAALQELTGRHPNEVYEGIALVQIVEYQAVGLRRRAMVDVARRAAVLHEMYSVALVNALLGWRGLGSADVISREAAATSLAQLSQVFSERGSGVEVLDKVLYQLTQCSPSDAEALHGSLLSLAYIIGTMTTSLSTSHREHLAKAWKVVDRMPDYLSNFSARVSRSETPSAVSRLLEALCQTELSIRASGHGGDDLSFDALESVLERLLARQEDSILLTIPATAKAVLQLKRKAGVPLGCIGAQTLWSKVSSDASKSTLQGAGRAIALGALAGLYDAGLSGQKAMSAIMTLANLTEAMNVDWRIIGVKALQYVFEDAGEDRPIEPRILEQIVQAVHRGMRDYTIDERGDVGSLVRLQAIACAASIFNYNSLGSFSIGAPEILRDDITRLSLEKLDRVRTAAAHCRSKWLGFEWTVMDLTSVSTYDYFTAALQPLQTPSQDRKLETALLEGCISCAGISAEPLLQASRAALTDILWNLDDPVLLTHLTTFTANLKTLLTELPSSTHPALELLAFLLAMQIPQRLALQPDFKWLNLLSIVQKSHHKSNDLPKIFAAVQAYRGLADVPSLRREVVKKLMSMLRTNPYPLVRIAVAETLFVVTSDERLMGRDWAAPVPRNRDVLMEVERSQVGA